MEQIEEGSFHVATPIDFESKDPENEVINPTINGVLSIIKSCAKAGSVRRLVFTSSAGTVNVEEQRPPEYDESCWSDLEFINDKNAWMDVLYVNNTGREGCKGGIHGEQHRIREYYTNSRCWSIYNANHATQPHHCTVPTHCKFKDIDRNLKAVSFSSKKLTDLGFQFKYSLEDMYKGAIETCREKGLIPLPSEKEKQANGEN
ncbi:Dihydroflavonol 4-reductase [Vitis vinifera]|uniref:Dihydroflavonol 4-reductase n=1 Tax=Vitis vinifera TaxID=29760 RepID=A0A438BRA6_VITVI|nr:Dihydroflavonol 4-reductase [Vitis vinifera]